MRCNPHGKVARGSQALREEKVARWRELTTTHKGRRWREEVDEDSWGVGGACGNEKCSA
jgi:hypothetical protein